MIDPLFARQAFIVGLHQQTASLSDLRKRCTEACASGLPRTIVKGEQCHTTIAKARARHWFRRWPEGEPAWLREWAESKAELLFGELCFQGLNARLFTTHELLTGRSRHLWTDRRVPDATLCTVPELLWALQDAIEVMRIEEKRRRKTRRPRSRTEAHAEVDAFFDAQETALAERGLVLTRRGEKLRLHAEWYVLVSVVGFTETQIRDEAFERDPNASLDLSTVKKGVKNFAELVGLPLPPVSDRKKQA